MSKLLAPDLVEKVIETYWDEEEEPPVYVIDLSWKLMRMAYFNAALSEADVARLDDLRATLEEQRRSGLSPKNMALVRQVLADGVWRGVCSLPHVLMQQAYDTLLHAPVKAALTAQIAIAIAILVRAPVRLKNLVAIELDKHLTKPGLDRHRFFLHFDAREVKNKVDLDFPLDNDVSALIDRYVQDFRPILQRRSNTAVLFPGEGGKSKTKTTLSDQISERIHKALGLTITTHQFRHAAAAIYLKENPGDHETVRRLLGHKNIQTTINFYIGLQTIHANEQFGKIIHSLIEDELVAAEADH